MEAFTYLKYYILSKEDIVVSKIIRMAPRDIEDMDMLMPSTQAFLWTLESRGITGHYTGTASEEALAELSRLVVMLLKLTYWDEVG